MFVQNAKCICPNFGWNVSLQKCTSRHIAEVVISHVAQYDKRYSTMLFLIYITHPRYKNTGWV